MITEQQQDQASLYVLGALNPDEGRAVEAELRQNAELRSLVNDFRRTVELMAVASLAAELPAGLKNKVLQRIESGGQRTDDAPIAAAMGGPGLVFKAASKSTGWKELPVRGAWIKLLSIERDRNYAVVLGRLEAGVRYPGHQHEGPEDFCILTGDLNVGGVELGPGDFHHADAGTAHGVNYSVNGCTLIAVLPANHELVQFAMA